MREVKWRSVFLGRIVGETSPVGKSILVPESRGVENMVDRVW